MEISIYIILFGDLGFLYDILSTIHHKVKEIIIVDGPYIYNIDYLKKLGVYYDEHSKPDELTRIIEKYNVKYFNKIFNNEEEKRIFGYNCCSCDNILLVDADEFFIFDENKIIDFINSEKSVTGFGIYNMNRVDMYFDDYCTKLVLFKKNQITAQEHLDYLWLIGCKTNPPDNNKIYNEKMGDIYHQTLNRSRYNNIIKYIFYITLYFYNKNENKLFDNYDLDYLIDCLGLENLLNIFYHSHIGLIGMPHKDTQVLRWVLPTIISHSRYNSNHKDAILKPENLLVKGIPFFCYTDESIFYFENVKNMEITVYRYQILKTRVVCNYKFETNNFNDNFTIQLEKNHDIINVVMFNCLETINENITCKVKISN